MSAKVFLILALIICCSIANILGGCEVQFSEDQAKRPTVYKKIGSHHVHIPNKPTLIRLQDGEELTAQCNTSFISPNAFVGYKQIDLNCQHDRINGNYYSRFIMECDTSPWSMYEALHSFNWCPPPLESYIVAQPTGGRRFEIVAGICYSFQDMSVQAMHYVMTPSTSQYLFRNMFREYIPSTKVQYVPDNFASRVITSSIYGNPQIKHWMAFAKYESQSLLQNSHIYPDSNIQLGGLLDIAWWSGLRLGNWQLYEEALSQFIETDEIEYDILAGISGAVAAPIYKGICDKNRTWLDMVDDMDRTMPLYVWHYLKSTRHESDNVVVIGVNSPFYEFYDEKDIKFCTDICSQLDWLQKVQPIFQFKSMGVIFCCSVEEVQRSWRLTGFPQIRMDTSLESVHEYDEYNGESHNYDHSENYRESNFI